VSEPVIRDYRDDDREAVRRVCFETGYMGQPIAWQYSDEASFAHLFCDWYLDRYAHCASVVDLDGAVVGYRLGCPDIRDASLAAHERAYATHHVIGRGLIVRPGTAGFLWRSARDLLTDRGVLRPPVDHERFPADLHIDFLPAARGAGIGRRMVTAWLERLTADGVPGIHLGAWGENAPALAFFTSLGFEPVGDPSRSPGLRQRDGSRCTVQWMAREL
jgi:ribosomal protein S18 acetylase RimI-like enzyme